MANPATYGSKLGNTSLWNGSEMPEITYSPDTLVFENFSLSDGTVMILTNLRVSGPSRVMVEGNVPRGDGMFITADYFREYPIEAEGIVKMSTAAELDAKIDEIKKSLSAREGVLDYTDANGTAKRFLATLLNFEELFADRRHYHITYCPWRARFVCKTPFGKARAYEVTDLTVTTSPTSQDVNNLGTYKAQPIFILGFDAASSVTVVKAENTTTGESITYTGTISAGDVLKFDSENKQVTLNGVAVDFTGGFPSLATGNNTIRFTITATSFTSTATIKYKPTYL